MPDRPEWLWGLYLQQLFCRPQRIPRIPFTTDNDRDEVASKFRSDLLTEIKFETDDAGLARNLNTQF